MFNFDNLKIRTKALIPIGLAVAAMLGISIFSGLQLGAFARRSFDIIDGRDKAQVDLLQAARFINRALTISFRGVLYDVSDPLVKDAEATLKEDIASVIANLDDAARLLPERRAEIDAMNARFKSIRAPLTRSIELGATVPALAAGRALKPLELDVLAEAAQVMNGADKVAIKLTKDLAQMVKAVAAENAAMSAQLVRDGEAALKLLFAAGIVATLLAVASSMWIVSRNISGPLGGLARRMKTLAEGDLDAEILGAGRRDEVGEMAAAVQVFRVNAIERKRIEAEAESNRALAEEERRQAAAHRAQAADERAALAQRETEQLTRTASEREAAAAEQARAMRHIGDAIRALATKTLTHRIGERLHPDYEPLRAEFNAALAQLSQAFVDVAASADAVHQGTQEITAAANDLARRTEQQASNIEKSASSLNEITATVQKTASGAAAARDSVAMARADAARGADVITLTTQAMSRIEASSQKVSEIIGVIDEIAFQTNLLALNAGVEAARAGEAGRGFAVVASEVRALAQRAADAAKEIKALIHSSGQEVANGVDLVAQTGGALDQIGKTVIRIDEIVTAIAADAGAQASGLAEVNTAVRQVDQMTQQNAAMAEEATAAGASLARESERLSGLMAQFSVERGDGGGLRAELRRAAPHAFAQRPAEAAPPRPARPQRVAAGGAAAARAVEEDWKEF